MFSDSHFRLKKIGCSENSKFGVIHILQFPVIESTLFFVWCDSYRANVLLLKKRDGGIGLFVANQGIIQESIFAELKINLASHSIREEQ